MFFLNLLLFAATPAIEHQTNWFYKQGKNLITEEVQNNFKFLKEKNVNLKFLPGFVLDFGERVFFASDFSLKLKFFFPKILKQKSCEKAFLITGFQPLGFRKDEKGDFALFSGCKFGIEFCNGVFVCLNINLIWYHDLLNSQRFFDKQWAFYISFYFLSMDL